MSSTLPYFVRGGSGRRKLSWAWRSSGGRTMAKDGYVSPTLSAACFLPFCRVEQMFFDRCSDSLVYMWCVLQADCCWRFTAWRALCSPCSPYLDSFGVIMTFILAPYFVVFMRGPGERQRNGSGWGLAPRNGRRIQHFSQGERTYRRDSPCRLKATSLSCAQDSRWPWHCPDCRVSSVVTSKFL